MRHYLLAIQQPDGDPPPPEVFEPILRAVQEFNAEAREAGVWVFGGGLHGVDAATVVRVHAGETLTTDGPYVEGREHVGGLTIIAVDDLDAALAWGRRLAAATTLPIEVRPFQGGPDEHLA